MKQAPTPRAVPAVASKLAIIVSMLVGALPALAQTRSARDTATAYGARLTAKGVPANLNQNRLNNRINNRLDNRLALRIERYRPDSSNNPTAAFKSTQNDNSRIAPTPDSAQQLAAQQYEQQTESRP